MRILGKGKTAQAIKDIYKDAVLFDDNDKEIYDINSDELTVVSPGIPPHNYLVQNTKNLMSDYDLFLKEDMFTIWISGTNGKTTTTSMLYYLLKNDGFECGGNIGTPLANIQNSKKLILETSSFTLHYTNKVKPNIYILLPVSEDHLYWHGSFEEYENAKLKPLCNMTKNDIAILPLKYKNRKTNATTYFYTDTQSLAKEFDIELSEIGFKEPFLQDAVLALVATKIYNKKTDYKKINTFVQDPHKLEEYKDKNGKLWIDDSKATNIDATLHALKCYKEYKINIILGGDDKGVDLNPLFEELTNYNVKIFSLGSNTKKLFELSNKYNIECVKLSILDEVVALLCSKEYYLDDNTLNLLSPAASSLDQFESYKHRGEEFKAFIQKYVN